MVADLESAEKIHLKIVGWHFCLNFVVDQCDQNVNIVFAKTLQLFTPLLIFITIS